MKRGMPSLRPMQKKNFLMEHHLSLNPYDAYAWNYLGKIQERTDPDKALKSYENAIKS
jgi:cytochrome c-type biogenesis protein CcmH/NrfG